MSHQPQTQYLAVYQVYHPDFKQLQLFGGQLPSAPDENRRSHIINELVRMGITRSLCLMEADELKYYSSYTEEFLQRIPEAKWLHYPIVDMSIPNKAFMAEILNKLDELIAANEKIYVHCLGGHGRTGTVIGCWLKRHGVKQGDIYMNLAKWRADTLFGKVSSPQSPEQFMMINEWQNGL